MGHVWFCRGVKMAVIALAAWCVVAMPVHGDDSSGKDKSKEKLPPRALVRLGEAHNAMVGQGRAVDFSDDGKFVAVASSSGQIYLWDARTQQRDGKEFHGSAGSVYSLDISPNGRWIITGHSSKVSLWDVEKRKLVRSFSVKARYARSVRFGPDNKRIAAACSSGNGRVVIADPFSGKVQAQSKQLDKKSLYAVAWSPDGKTIAVGGRDRGVHLFDTKTGKTKANIKYPQYAYALAYSPDGETLAIGDYVGNVALVSMKNLKVRKSVKGHERYIRAVAYSRNGKRVVSRGYDKRICVWDAETGKKVKQFIDGYTSPYYDSVAISPDGDMVAASSYAQVVNLWHVNERADEAVRKGHRAPIIGIAVRGDGKAIATSGMNGGVIVWDTATGEPVDHLPHARGGRNGVAFEGEKVWVAAADYHNVALQQVGDKKPRRTINHRYIKQVAISPDGKVLATAGSDRHVRLWDVETGKTKRDFAGFRYYAGGFAFLPRFDTFAVIDRDQVVLYNYRSGQVTGSISNGSLSHYRCEVTLSRDGRLITVSTPSRDVHTYDLYSRREVTKLSSDGAQNLYYEGRPIAFHPIYSTLLATSGKDNAVEIWNVATGQRVLSMKGHRAQVSKVHFTPDGLKLVSGSADGSAIVWDVASLQHRKDRTLVLRPDQLKSYLDRLGDNDPRQAYQAVQMLARSPKQAVDAIAVRFKPATVDNDRIAGWLEDLDHDAYRVRERATVQLERLGPAARRSVERAMRTTTSAEVRWRCARILASQGKTNVTDARTLRIVRAIHVLELIDSQASIALLNEYADGAEGAILTRHAKRALERLSADEEA